MTTLTGQWMWGPGAIQGVIAASSADYSTHNLDDADDAMRVTFIVPKDGTLNRVGVYVEAITGNPPAYNVSLKDMAGSAYGGSATEAYDFTAAGYIWVTLSTPATAAAGDLIEAIIEPGASTPDASNYAQVRRSCGATSMDLPRGAYYSTSWLSTTNSIGVLYSDGTVAIPGLTSSRAGYIRTTSTPDEVGALFQVPFACKCVGVQLCADPTTSSADYDVVLYSAADVALATLSHDATYHGAGGGPHTYYWDPVSLSASTNYRLTVLPTSAVYTYVLGQLVDSVASREWWPEGVRWQLTERTDAGAWTETNTALPMFALILSEITLPDPGGGGSPWSGGMIIG